VAKASGTSRAFKVFAIFMVLFLLLGTLVVFGGAIFGSDPGDNGSPVDEAARQKAELETRVADNPNDADNVAILANIYANEGNIVDAIPLYERATIGRPDDGNLRLAFGIALLRDGSLLDARVQFERALDLLPNSSGPAYYLGRLEQEKSEPDLEAARGWYERAIEIDPESVLASDASTRLAQLDAADATPTP
jgi:tetratricopeptide (TPR) repeat protein